MKNLILTLVLALGFGVASAQLIKEKAPVNDIYLAGAVPVVDGKVTFSYDIDLPHQVPADTLYKQLSRWIGGYFNRAEVLNRKSTANDSINHYREIGIVQYITFKQSNWVLDRSQIIYRLNLQVTDNKVNISMTDISYLYEEDRKPEKFTAEEWITDEVALNRKKDGLVRNCGKFRIKTIDLFSDICVELTTFIQREQMDLFEQAPDYDGGESALMEFIKENLKYPAYEAENGIQGRVTLLFTIEKDGSITGIKALRSPSKGLTDEAIRMVKAMPKWKPAMKNGQSMRTSHLLPITFRLR